MESRLMATITQLKHTPHTRIENTIIANMSDIGVYCYAVYCAIKMHVNQATGDCFPSYATIARITGIHRSTVIECVKKLRALKHISPLWRFKEDGSHASNQYDFQCPGKAGHSKKPEEIVKTEQGGRQERPPVVAQDDYPGRQERPEQSPLPNKKQRTIDDVDFFAEKSQLVPVGSQLLPVGTSGPTDKQKTCTHPLSEVVRLSDNIIVCHHCYGLLDENHTLASEKQPAEIVEAA
jgi:hypothetical protein